MKPFRAYLTAILSGMVQSVLLFFDVLGIVLFISPQIWESIGDNTPWLQLGGVALFVVSFSAANYLAFKRLYFATQKQPGTILLGHAHTKWWIGGSRDGVPVGPIECHLQFHLSNPGDELAVLRSIEVAELSVPVDWIASKPSSIAWRIQNGDSAAKTMPLATPQRIEPHTWRIDLTCKLELQLLNWSDTRYAAQFNELHGRGYTVCLLFSFDSPGQPEVHQFIDVKGNFQEFRRHTLRQWVQDKRYELLFAAVDVERLLDEE